MDITRHTSVGGSGALLHLSGTRGSDVNSIQSCKIMVVSELYHFKVQMVMNLFKFYNPSNVDGTPGDNDIKD